jgi:nitrite reductase/ring-hydroxylating ferredoxin subunit
MMIMMITAVLCSISCVTTTIVVEAFQPNIITLSSVVPIRTPLSIHMVRRGKGSIGKEIGNNNDSEGGTNSIGMGGDSTTSASTSNSNIQWTPIAVSVKALPTEENKVTLIDTNLITMKNAQTNPTGAVSVLQYQKQMHCFAVNCPSCQIPLLKAKCISSTTTTGSNPPKSSFSLPPLLQCDLCKATYDLKTGEKITTDTTIGEKPGLLGGIVKSLFSSKASGPLKVYKLAEKNGKLLIAGLD